jgi:hypothetical protein
MGLAVYNMFAHSRLLVDIDIVPYSSDAPKASAILTMCSFYEYVTLLQMLTLIAPRQGTESIQENLTI